MIVQDRLPVEHTLLRVMPDEVAIGPGLAVHHERLPTPTTTGEDALPPLHKTPATTLEDLRLLSMTGALPARLVILPPIYPTAVTNLPSAAIIRKKTTNKMGTLLPPAQQHLATALMIVLLLLVPLVATAQALPPVPAPCLLTTAAGLVLLVVVLHLVPVSAVHPATSHHLRLVVVVA